MISDVLDFITGLRELGVAGLTILIIILLMLRFFDINKKVVDEKEELTNEFWGTVGEKLREVMKDVLAVSYGNCQKQADKRIEALQFIIRGVEDSIDNLYRQIVKATVIDNSIVVSPDIPCAKCKPNYSLLIENRITRVQFLQSEINAHKSTIREHKKEIEKIYKDLDVIESVLTLSLYEHHAEVLTELKRMLWKGLTGANLDKYIETTADTLLQHNRQRIKSMLSPKVMFFQIPEERYGLDNAKKHYGLIVDFVIFEYGNYLEKSKELVDENPFLPYGIERVFLRKEK